MTAFRTTNRTDPVSRFEIRRFTHDGERRDTDLVAVEEPFAITLAYWFKEKLLTADLAVTMRTPGADRELALGLLLSEGVIASEADVADVRTAGTQANELIVELHAGVDVEGWRLARNQFVSTACGICGKQNMDAVRSRCGEPVNSNLTVPSSVIYQVAESLHDRQQGFAQTGGLHAAALFDAAGEIIEAFEDVGRHNALDKVIGSSINRIPLQDYGLFTSSRGSFELVQKCMMARCPLLATVGGPSSLAIEAARDFGITLIGFVRDGRCNVYSGEWRLHS